MAQNKEKAPQVAAVELADSSDADAVETIEPIELIAVVGKSCVTVGPFRNRDDADEAETRYKSEGMDTGRRSGQGEFFVGHWVQIRDVPNKEESRRMIGLLKDAGLADAYPVETEDEGLKISLGLFGNLESAEQIEAQARALGLPADVSPRMSEGTVYWVDLALPQGRGAGEIVERYGEDQVRLRNRARCP
jgi:hypothetical protein